MTALQKEVRIIRNIKFCDIYVIDLIGRVVQGHTEHYQSDFEIDKEILWEAAGHQAGQDRSFIWLCRTAGTWLLSERDVFLKGTSADDIFDLYVEQASDPVLAFAINVKRTIADTIIGDIYVLDYQAHHRHIQSVALSAETVVLRYERMMRVDEMPGPYPDMGYGRRMSRHYLPHEQTGRFLRKIS